MKNDYRGIKSCVRGAWYFGAIFVALMGCSNDEKSEEEETSASAQDDTAACLFLSSIVDRSKSERKMDLEVSNRNKAVASAVQFAKDHNLLATYSESTYHLSTDPCPGVDSVQQGDTTNDSGSDPAVVSGSSSVAPAEEEVTISAALTFPDVTRALVIEDELIVTFSGHDADSVSCSADGGVTFNDCTTNDSFAWNFEDRAATHIVRFEKDGASNSPLNLTFVPEDAFESVSVAYECTQEVTANEDFNTFNARVGASEIICLSDGVSIYNDDALSQGMITLGSAGVMVFVREGDTASFINEDSSEIHVMYANTFAFLVGVTITGLEDVHDGIYFDTGSAPYIYYSNITGGVSGLVADGTSQGSIYKSQISVSSSTAGSGVEVTGGGTLDLVFDTQIEINTDGGSAVYVNGGTITSINSSELTASSGPAIKTSDALGVNTVNVTGSFLRCGSTTDTCVYWDNNSNGTTVLLNSSVLLINGELTSSVAAIEGTGNGGSEVGQLQLYSTLFARADTSGTNNNPAINVTNTSTNNSVMVGDNANSLCAENSASNTWSSFLTIDTAQSGFDVSAQTNSGAVSTCSDPNLFN